MVFSFLKYLRPVWYFNLKPKIDNGYFPTLQQLENIGYKVVLDNDFKSNESKERFAAWVAFQEGCINTNLNEGLNVWNFVKLPLLDEYTFLRKNFHKAWIYYVLLLRLLSFKNPINEIVAVLKTSKIKRIDYSKNKFLFSDYDGFDSELIKRNPLVSVIIPTLNRYDYLKDVLIDLENQTYKNFEVIIVDQTDDFKADFYKNWKLDLTFWYQKEKALWLARNEAIQKLKGDLILLYDDDSLVEKNWIEEHLKALDYFKADLSSGVSISEVGAEVPAHYSYFRWSDQLDTGNVLLKKDVFQKIGLFDRQFEKQRMGDGEFGLRCYLNGFKNISNYKAKRIHLKVGQGGLRQMGSWDGWRPKKLFGPRPVPSVLYLSRKYFGSKLSKYYILHSIIPSIVPYQFKKNKALKMLSFIMLPLLFPLVCFQVVKSWQLASQKLREGNKIGWLNDKL